MKLKRKESGFTLVELLIATAILGTITGALSMAIVAVMKTSDVSKDWAVSLQQVQNAGYWISRDVLMAQDVSPEPTSGVLVRLDLDGSQVDYVFDGSMLKRQLDGSQEILIAEYIVQGDTTFEEDTEVDSKYKLTIKASRGEAEVERSYEATQRIPGESE